MKRFFAILVSAIILCSCEKIDIYTINAESKTEYEHTVGDITFVANTETHTYHLPSCYLLNRTKEENKWETKDIDYLVSRGFKPCRNCIK